jgi:large subunit ribosomal protein L1
MWRELNDMANLSKRAKALTEKVDKNRTYKALDAFDLLKKLSEVKFIESIDVSVKLGVDPRKSDQVV